MATFTPIKNQKQTKGALLGTMLYAINKRKTTYEGQSLVSGFNCSAYTSYLEMMTTKQQYRKTDKQQFFQFVQSFPEDTDLTPQEVHQIGLEFAAQQFADYEVLVATHCDTDNFHNHLLVNSVSFKTGKKLHQNHDDLVQHRKINDEICLAHGQQVLESYHKGQKKNGRWRENTAPLSAVRAGSLRLLKRSRTPCCTVQTGKALSKTWSTKATKYSGATAGNISPTPVPTG